MPKGWNFASIAEARKASVNMMPGTSIHIKGHPAMVVTPGRSRRKGAPKAIRFLSSIGSL